MKKVIQIVAPGAKGVGDLIEKTMKRTGAKRLVSFLFKDCGCDERRDQLNKKFPLVKITDEQKERIRLLFDRPGTTLERGQSVEMYSLYNEIFGTRRKPCNCPGTSQRMAEDLISLGEMCN